MAAPTLVTAALSALLAAPAADPPIPEIAQLDPVPKASVAPMPAEAPSEVASKIIGNGRLQFPSESSDGDATGAPSRARDGETASRIIGNGGPAA